MPYTTQYCPYDGGSFDWSEFFGEEGYNLLPRLHFGTGYSHLERRVPLILELPNGAFECRFVDLLEHQKRALIEALKDGVEIYIVYFSKTASKRSIYALNRLLALSDSPIIKGIPGTTDWFERDRGRREASENNIVYDSADVRELERIYHGAAGTEAPTEVKASPVLPEDVFEVEPTEVEAVPYDLRLLL